MVLRASYYLALVLLTAQMTLLALLSGAYSYPRHDELCDSLEDNRRVRRCKIGAEKVGKRLAMRDDDHHCASLKQVREDVDIQRV